MKPKFKKLITLLLLSITFALLTAAEEKVTAMVKRGLSEWASSLPDDDSRPQKSKSLNPYSKSANFLDLAHRLFKK